ncbi:protein ROOT INITIATION DEFECTIVE 3-like [Carica papaya]|uniref:protein ROOT INITIATION DEFECTIVE 3-like n=1 Tax=Carica papaya TaxID=3649 RepID=UPI000B8CA3D5|nr:protein ROOT INITIATION DEFECTIVE 3-like [Carica papaya]
MGKGGEALVVCSDRSMGIGVTVWDVDSGDQLLHIPTCAASPHGLLCLRNQFIVASQVNRHGSMGGGAVFIWSLNKPHSPIRSYTMEAIGPLCSTRDGVYLAGGSPSGNAYLWEVSTGRLLKAWAAHDKCLKCMAFSDDGSILISSSDDGMLCMWSMISLLDMEDSGSLPLLLHCSLEHTSSITGLLTMSPSASATFVSSSLDGTCKVWDQISGIPIKTQVYPVAITAIVLHPGERVLFSGSIDGSIFVDELDIGRVEDPFSVTDNQPVVLKGHKGSIIAMSFSKSGLISASKDCSVCLWDVNNQVIIRRFNHQKGAITNTVIIPRSVLLNHQRSSNQYRISLLEKYPQRPNSANGTIISLPPFSSLKGNHTSAGLQKTSLLDQHLFDSKAELWGAYDGLQLDWDTECRNIILEMDSSLVVQVLTKEDYETNAHAALVRAIKYLLLQD